MGQLQQQTTSFEAFAHNTMMKTETIALLMAALLALSAVTHPVMTQDRDDPDADRDADEADGSSRETSSMMWFSIDASAKPSAIVWDPVTGLSANPLSGASAAASLSLAVVLSAVLVAAFAM